MTITRDNIFANEKYMNIIRVLDAYPDGLEFNQLCYIFFGEKKLIQDKYIKEPTANYIKKYLEKFKKKEYNLIIKNKNDEIRHISRLSDYISKLRFQLDFIYKEKNKYKLKEKSKVIMSLTAYKNIIERQLLFTKIFKSIDDSELAVLNNQNYLLFSLDPFFNKIIQEKKYKERLFHLSEDLKRILATIKKLRKDIKNDYIEQNIININGEEEGTKLLKKFKNENLPLDEDHIFFSDVSKMKTNLLLMMNTYDDLLEIYSDSLWNIENPPPIFHLFPGRKKPIDNNISKEES